MNSSTQQAVAQAVRVQRVRSGLKSDADLARRAGISPSGLTKRLQGDIRMDLVDVDVIARALGLPDGFALMDIARTEQQSSAA